MDVRVIHRTCPTCGRTFGQPDDPGRKRRFCSDACKQAAYRARKRASDSTGFRGSRRLPPEGRTAPRQVRPLARERSTARTAWAGSRPSRTTEGPGRIVRPGPSAFPASRCRPW
jgi:predicted nucleic acid-binding Zn ribbon protein